MKNRIRNFEIQTKLGSGSYGVIYKAVNKSNKEVCVLKQISLGRLSEKARKSAINEATIMGKLIHPFIVRYKESFIEENTLNIVMEFCDSGDLSNYLKMQNKKPLKEEKIWKFFIEICVGLEYIHKNKILHRDIKTLNIFMNKNEEIKIGDLGVAKMLTSNEFAQTMVGTPFYLSPELCEEKPYNEKSDIWALGCMLYELCTYRHPFEAQTQPSLILKIIRGKYKYSPIPQFYSKQLKEIIDLCLERDYKRRPTTSNLLAKPKMQEYYKVFGMEKIVEDYMAAVRSEKEGNRGVAKPVEEVKVQPAKERVVKAIDYKEVKKEEVVKKEEPRKEEIKKEVVINKPLQPQVSQKKIEKEVLEVKRNSAEEIVPRKDNKNEFAANLERLIDESNKKNIKQGPSYAQIQPKITQVVKKEQKYQRVLSKVEDIKKQQKIEVKSPNIDAKKCTPQVQQKKSGGSMDVIPSTKKQEQLQLKPSNMKPPLAKPPMPPSAQKEPIKVKNEKVIQPKVYQSQKMISKPQAVIKSGGFNPNVEPPQQKNDKPYHLPSSSKEKPVPERNIASAKRPSLPGIVKQEKIQSEEVKQLFGILPSPTVQHKSEKNLKNIVSSMDEPKPKKQEMVGNVSRVRKGGPNVLSRNARNVSRYNQISKQEKDQVMNLPNKLNNKGNSSSDSQQQIYSRRNHVIDDLKGKTNKKFKLKEIDNDLVLQKYEDLMKSEEAQNTDTVPNSNDLQSQEEMQTSNQFQQEIKDDIERDEIIEPMDDNNIVEEVDLERKGSGRSDEQIEEVLQAEIEEQNLQKEQNLEQQFQDEDYITAQEKEEWSFDEEPELPLLQEKQSPYFEQNNPYLIEQQPQEQTEQNKINYLQTKLSENLKREDEINKLMQIKIDECRKFIGNEKTFQQILLFFRKKLNMDDEYNEQDEKQIQNFLKRKGLTDHRKFQNIYKIMHFQMQLENTRTIIQRICKKLNELTGN